MRRAGRIPYGWITDATRAGYHVDTFNTPGEFLQSVAASLSRQSVGKFRATTAKCGPNHGHFRGSSARALRMSLP